MTLHTYVDDWPPVSFAANDHILVWWLPEYDDAIRASIQEYEWAWRAVITDRLIELVPDQILRAWRSSDPQCEEFQWQGALFVFVLARAKQLGLHPRDAQDRTCSCCSKTFHESAVGFGFIRRLGVDRVTLCGQCLGEALNRTGNPDASRQLMIGVIQTLSKHLGRLAKSSDLYARFDFGDLSNEARGAIVQALRIKPSLSRVKQAFGSWQEAVNQAMAAPPEMLPPYEPLPVRSREGDMEFKSDDPNVYETLVGLPPKVRLDPDREPRTYFGEIESLIGTGQLGLAESASLSLLERADFYERRSLCYKLASFCGQTAHDEEARTFISMVDDPAEVGTAPDRFEYLLRRRDTRTITSRPLFYAPLASNPRGAVRFVLLGGPMEYADRRGEHSCTTGEESDEGRTTADFSECVARVNAMVDGNVWVQAATKLGSAIIASHARADDSTKPFAHAVAYVTSHLREAVKSLSGSLPTKIREDEWRIGRVGRSGWSYQNDASRFPFNADMGFTAIDVERSPTLVVWAWPDRSDLAFQAFLDTVAVTGPEPVTAIVPDVPAFRDFARRYVQKQEMWKVSRALLEECLYRHPRNMPGKRGRVLSAQFAPQLVIHPDGVEEDGARMTSALAYLDVQHSLRLTVWDVLRDQLLGDAAAALQTQPDHFALSDDVRLEAVRWYRQLPEYDDPGILLEPSRPSLLDAIV
jgi:hypothetical protein